MTAQAAVIARTWTVGKRYSVTLTVPRPVAGKVVCASCEWAPHLPDRLNRREQRDYLRGMQQATRDLDLSSSTTNPKAP